MEEAPIIFCDGCRYHPVVHSIIHKREENMIGLHTAKIDEIFPD